MKSYNLVLKDAFWQIFGKVVSALIGFLVVKLITPYLGPLRYGDYSTVLNYFVLWTAFADFGLYVISLKDLGEMRHSGQSDSELSIRYSQYVWSRFFMIWIIYAVAMMVAYMLPSYTSNIYLLRGLPLGMVYSATALGGSMFRLPLQLNWDMKHVTIALFLARIAQILVLILTIYVFAPVDSFSVENLPLAVFLAVVWSALVSAIVEFLYVYFVGNKHIRLVRVSFLSFWKEFIVEKWKYGMSQFFAGLYIPLILVLLSVLYPTIEWFEYVGQWWLALSLVGMLLIVPSSLGNSMLHKVSWSDLKSQSYNFWSFFLLMLWLWLLLLVNFLIYAKPIIYFVSWEKYLSWLNMTVYDSIWYVFSHLSILDQTMLWADFLLPMFAIILLISFVKNVFTYAFVASHNHNSLFKVNMVSVIVWLVIGYLLVDEFQLVWALLGQLIFGVTFLILYLSESLRLHILPRFLWKDVLKVVGFFLLLWIAWYFVDIKSDQFLLFIGSAAILNLAVLGIWFKWLKRVAKGLV